MSNQNSGPPPGWPAPSESPYGPGKTVVGEPLEAGMFPPPEGAPGAPPGGAPGVSATVIDGGPGATAEGGLPDMPYPRDWDRYERMPAPVYGAPPMPNPEPPAPFPPAGFDPNFGA